MTTQETTSLAEAKLASSGLDWNDAKVLGITAVDNMKSGLHDSFMSVPGLGVGFFDIAGEPIKDWPKAPDYYRVRRLKDVEEGAGFASQVKPDGKKYSQEPGTGLCAYIPQNLEVGWPNIAEDPDEPIIITEGELKAACACKHGLPAIGLGGVDSYKHDKWGREILPEMKLINWGKRPVYIIYDSDADTNPNISRAINDLATMLMNQGAIPRRVILPQVYSINPDPKLQKKTGLDDFLVERTIADLELLMDQAQVLTQVQGLYELNARYAWVKEKDRVLEFSSGRLREPGVWSKGTEATKRAYDFSLNKEGELKYELVSAADLWLKWQARSTIDDIDYLPGLAAKTVIEHENRLIYNTWTGWGAPAIKGDVTLFKQLVEHLTSASEPWMYEYVMQWIAHPIQNPGIKMATALLIWSSAHGTGKSMLGETLKKVYGENGKELGQEELLNHAFNSWASNKQFIMVNEVEGTDRRESTMMYKNFITRETKSINRKYMEQYDQVDRSNYYFTSNQPNAIILEDKDRRFIVVEGPSEAKLDEFYTLYKAWRDTPEGVSALRWYLENEVDCKGFNPSARAKDTRAKREMAFSTLKPDAALVKNLQMDPDSVLIVGTTVLKQDLFTAEELKAILDPSNEIIKSAHIMGTILKTAGFRQYSYGDMAMVKWENKNHRFYIVRNKERWLHATPEEVRAHLNLTIRGLEPKKPRAKKF